MILVIDIGNTTIAFTGMKMLLQEGKNACGGQEDLQDFAVLFEEKIPTQTGKDLSLFLEKSSEILKIHGNENIVRAVAVSSVVPACTAAAQELSRRICGRDPVTVSYLCSTGLSFGEIPWPQKVGADRIADAAWAAAHYPLPAMTVDMGTATTINVVSSRKEFLGGMIGAGVRTSLRALGAGTAQLPDLEPGPVPKERLIGNDTVGCMLSAAVVGTASMIDGITAHVEEQLGSQLTLILTGGNAPFVSEWVRHPHIYEPDLAAKGTALIALQTMKNQE